MKRQAVDWEKRLVNRNLMKDFYPEYEENPQNSAIRNLNKVCLELS